MWQGDVGKSVSFGGVKLLGSWPDLVDQVFACPCLLQIRHSAIEPGQSGTVLGASTFLFSYVSLVCRRDIHGMIGTAMIQLVSDSSDDSSPACDLH